MQFTLEIHSRVWKSDVYDFFQILSDRLLLHSSTNIKINILIKPKSSIDVFQEERDPPGAREGSPRQDVPRSLPTSEAAPGPQGEFQHLKIAESR